MPVLCRAAAVAVAVPTGVDTMANYEEVLHLIRYRNWHTASLFDRKFKLLCSELNGRYVSNEFQVEVGACPEGLGACTAQQHGTACLS